LLIEYTIEKLKYADLNELGIMILYILHGDCSKQGMH